MTRITSTDYRRPYRPRLIQLANRLGHRLAARGIESSLDTSSLLAAAQRQVGADDFGGGDFLHPMAVLLRAIEDEARLSPVGRMITRQRLINILANRLRAAIYFRGCPDILHKPAAPPLIITGLQRTGTTLLHRLLAADPTHRSLAAWEAINPAPYPSEGVVGDNGASHRRLGLARLSEQGLSYIAPDFFAIHPVQATAPEEDVLLLDYSFLSTVFESTLRVPSYSAWLEKQDLAPAYQYMRKLMLLLQWQRTGRRWVLKSPHHLEFLDTIFEVFPDARVIHTHRDPQETLASFASMISHGHGVFSDQVDPVEIGHHWLRKQAHMVGRTIEVRRRLPAERFVDVHYQQLVADPLGQVQRIYDAFGLELTEGAQRAMGTCLASSPQHRFGRHRYQLEDFDITPAQVEEVFADYYATYDVAKGV